MPNLFKAISVPDKMEFSRFPRQGLKPAFGSSKNPPLYLDSA